ncbi:hypothetical protein CITRIK5_80063 [Citricoccus sp. K5]|nr:hypothetical protein CITRIK5_80063 [Citricoccus sp. K5]
MVRPRVEQLNRSGSRHLGSQKPGHCLRTATSTAAPSVTAMTGHAELGTKWRLSELCRRTFCRDGNPGVRTPKQVGSGGLGRVAAGRRRFGD